MLSDDHACKPNVYILCFHKGQLDSHELMHLAQLMFSKHSSQHWEHAANVVQCSHLLYICKLGLIMVTIDAQLLY